MKTLGAAKLSTKGQVTISVQARRQFDLHVGDLLLFVEQDGNLVVKKA
jgi:bifunctional DNA-binding transcriptional regulator/antitoxin component of YhaV-PrlF toxin-antitoxin module